MKVAQQKNLLTIEEFKMKLQNTQKLLSQSNEELREQKDSNKTLEKKVKLLEGKLGDKKIKNKALKAELKGLKERTDSEISQLEKLL